MIQYNVLLLIPQNSRAMDHQMSSSHHFYCLHTYSLESSKIITMLKIFIVCSLETSLAIYGILILLILIGRAAFVFPLSALSNYMNRRRTHLITFKHQVSQFKHLLQLSFMQSWEKYTILCQSQASELAIYSDSHLVGWPHERCCFYCFGF